MQSTEVVIIGAGPYGLVSAAYLGAVGADFRIFGKVMEFWKEMPKGMLLRSAWDGSHLPNPAGDLRLDAYERAVGKPLADHITMSEFARYGDWYQRNAVPEVDSRLVSMVERGGSGFILTLDDGKQIEARRVVISTGLAAFSRTPGIFAGLPQSAVTHTCQEREFDGYAGQHVAVIGAGQSALECAALLNESGATVEVLTRGKRIHWLAQAGHISRESGRLARLVYPPGAVGPLGVNWVVQLPPLYRTLPDSLRRRVFTRALRPAGSGWVKPRTAGVTISVDVSVLDATMSGDRVRLSLSDETEREVDHVLLGTGYQVDIDRYAFLSPEVVRAVERIDRQPKLGRGFESSLPGLHFLGAPSDLSFGPLMRFVAGTGYAARALAASCRSDRVRRFVAPGIRGALTSQSGH
jgi:hypothetical protein